jgi:Na+/proline symporter
MDQLTALPTPALIALIVFAIVQIGVEVYAIIDIIRRPADRIVGEKKWVWIVLVLFVNLIGGIIYLVVGRKPAEVVQTQASNTTPDVARDAVDALYGEGGPK